MNFGKNVGVSCVLTNVHFLVIKDSFLMFLVKYFVRCEIFLEKLNKR